MVTSPAKVALRARVLAAHSAGTGGRAIGRLVGISDGTVRSIIKRWGGSSQPPIDARRCGRPPKFSKRFVASSVLPNQICLRFPLHFTWCRYKRQIIHCAEKHSFWSLRRIIRHMNENLIRGIMNRPQGAIIQVCFTTPLLLN